MVQILDSYTLEHRDVIIELAARLSLPAIYSNRLATSSGGLITYAVDDLNQFQRAATYVDRILNGAKPADLPVQQPTRFELSIPQYRQGARAHHPGNAVGHRRRGDPVRRREFITGSVVRRRGRWWRGRSSRRCR
jgi:hypothetical protein